MNDETSATTADSWGSLHYYLGRWTGTGSGKPGESYAEREYKLVLNEQFIYIKHPARLAGAHHVRDSGRG